MYSALPVTLDLLSSLRTERLTWRVGGALRSVFGGSIIFAILRRSPARGEHAPAPSRACRRPTHAGRQSVPTHPRPRLRLLKTLGARQKRQQARLPPLRRASGALLPHLPQHALRG